MDQRGRGIRDRGHGGRGQQDGLGSPEAGAGRGSQGSGRRRRDRRWRGNNGGIWQLVASPRKVAELLNLLLQLWVIIHNGPAQLDREKGAMIYRYDVDVRTEDLPMGGAAPGVSQHDLSAVKVELFRLYAAQFPDRVVAYDGQRCLLGPGLLPEGDFRVAVQGRVFHVTLKQLVP
ncbi:hypothetical protein Taro_050861 [Colocasia esculenta]|uniref:Uncharacterized protein n=1 Tax=Colocasia esculenta TaxID=4460 RepID=A0A843XF38_COLES|nr:hypothetical protein [Colocasia esculenta]